MKKLILYILISSLWPALNAEAQSQKKYPVKMSDHDKAEYLVKEMDQLIRENTDRLAQLSAKADSLYSLMSKIIDKGADTGYVKRRYYSEQLALLENQIHTISKLITLIQGKPSGNNPAPAYSPAHATPSSNPQPVPVATHQTTPTSNTKETENNTPKQNSERFFTDTRDGRTYRIVQIGDQLWMVENLMYSSGQGEFCYYNNVSHCNKYGKLYDWHTAKGICPRGWKLPSKADFETLFKTLGGDGEIAFNALIEGGETGFNAILGGWGDVNGNYDGLGTFGVWWSSTEQSNVNAWSMDMGAGIRDAGIDTNNKSTALSVRCMRNAFLSQQGK